MYSSDSETTAVEVYIYMHIFSDTYVIMHIYTHIHLTYSTLSSIKRFVKREWVYSADPSSQSAC